MWPFKKKLRQDETGWPESVYAELKKEVNLRIEKDRAELIAWTKRLPKFGSVKSCPKCKGESFKSDYIKASGPEYSIDAYRGIHVSYFGRNGPERIHRTCQCGYQWGEQPADFDAEAHHD